MELVEANRQIQLLEQRYHELTHVTRAVRNQLRASEDSDRGLQTELQALLERIEGKMHSILRQIENVEDSLLE
jgi:hypothetical protein